MHKYIYTNERIHACIHTQCDSNCFKDCKRYCQPLFEGKFAAGESISMHDYRNAYLYSLQTYICVLTTDQPQPLFEGDLAVCECVRTPGKGMHICTLCTHIQTHIFIHLFTTVAFVFKGIVR